MGCDIHMHVEYYNGYSKRWECGDYFRLEQNSTLEKPIYRFTPIYDWRNYSLFATLANVRNYGNTAYIDEPRGLPKDATDFVKADYKDWEWDAHSCSYLTLRELIDFHNEGYGLKRRGMIGPEAQKLLDEQGIFPDSWCQGTNNPEYELREWEEPSEILVPLIDKLKERADELNLIYDFSWDGRNVDECLEKAKNIRIVFWFDN